MKMRNTMQIINKTKEEFFEKISEMTTSGKSERRKQRKKEKTQINKDYKLYLDINLGY